MTINRFDSGMQWTLPSKMSDSALNFTAAVVPEQPSSHAFVVEADVPILSSGITLEKEKENVKADADKENFTNLVQQDINLIRIPSESDSGYEIHDVETVSQIQKSQERAKRLILSAHHNDIISTQKSSQPTLLDSQETVCPESEMDFSFLRAASYDQ